MLPKHHHSLICKQMQWLISPVVYILLSYLLVVLVSLVVSSRA